MRWHLFMFAHGNMKMIFLGDCPGAKDLKDAEIVSHKLNIQFDVVNFIDFYKQEVVEPMVQGYADGITP